ncbi:MAG TPA: hypothetical protein VN811_13460 [Thermoanaerobaculia bacterium]|nr:hypothetical protein [Thermoanaerobaculia bacterium]
MQDGPGSDAAPAAGDDERERVAAVLDQLRAGVRQRRAELATLSASGAATATGDGLDAELSGKLLQVRQSEYVREPVPTSHRPGLGRWIVLARKAGYKVFGKWLVRPLLEQQNAHNAASAALLQELAESEARLARQVRELTVRLEALERAKARPPDAGNA